ncbi:Ulp1-like peptidase [Cucumis melo var. makuwa]|uniref:Ulp1-like peptidase n=1 Tax=Cucumis melo var. makuwa TaxID=1194695 RepID=A0A5A7TNL5_CUCMM|nr:Ulp1-like peptidase [Cucumis melo var. makuwa]
MDTLDENEVDIGEVQSVEMYNELFDIPEQRDAPTKDCKGKDAVTTSVVGDCERQAKSWVVGELIKSKFKGAGRIYKPRDIIKDMRQDYDINMSYEKAWRARENAYERVRGSPEESYNLLRRYGEGLKFTNPGFLNCIRPVIVMDGTFLKNKYRGQLIVVVCLDGNNQIYPLAFGVVDRETDDSIQWFLEKLKCAIGEVPNLGFVIDRKTCFSKDLDKEEVVNLQTKECTCKEFQAEQLPCSHAIAAARDRNINVYSLCANYYTNECLLAAYAEAVYQVGNQSDWMAVPSDKYFPTTVSCQVHKIGSLIRDKLTKEQLQMFDKKIFGPLLNVNMVFNGQLIHHFLLSLLFGSENKKLITCLEIEENFKNFEFTNDNDAVKVALAVFIETVMVGKDKKTQFDMDILGRVDDEEAFKSFDWSTFFYTRLLNSLKTSLQGKKEAYELKKTTSSKAVWAYEVLSTANEQLAIRNSKGLIPRILRWNCTQAPSYKMLQKNIFDNKNMSTQEKAFMESRIRGDDNMQMEDDESIGAMNNKSLEQSDSSPQLSPQREQSQTVADQSEMHPITKKKRCRSKKSNDKEEQSHSKSYKKLKKEIKEVRKDLSTLTSIVCRMDDTITKQSLELYEMKQMLERLVQNQTENQGNDHTHQNDNEEHQQECSSDISIDYRDADLLMTIKDISDNLTAKSQKEKDLPQMITTLPLVSQPLVLCELAPLDQTIQIVNEESQLETTKQQVEIQKNDEAVTLVEKEPVTVPDKDDQEKPIKRRKLCKIANKKVPDEDEQDNNKAEWTDPTAHLTIWTEKDVEDYFNTAVGDYEGIPGWGDVNYVISCINIKEHRLAIAADMRKCKIYVFDSMPNYVEQKLVDEGLQMPARCIALLAIAIGVNLHSDNFTYGPWPVRRSKATLQKGRSLDCGIFCSKFIECLVTGSDLGCLTVPNMKLFGQ